MLKKDKGDKNVVNDDDDDDDDVNADDNDNSSGGKNIGMWTSTTIIQG